MSDFLPPVVAKLGANITEFKTKMADARGEMSKTEKDGSSSLSSLAKGVATSVAGIGTAVVGMAASSLKKFSDVAEAVDGLQDITGESAEATSRLQYAFQSWGISSDQVQKSMKTLTKAVASGNPIFDEFGIKTKDAQGNTLSMSQIVANSADVFAKMPDGIDKTNLALKLFGKSGDEMLDVMNGGSAGLKELGDEADKFGITIGQKAVDSQQKNAKSTRQMHAAWEGLQIQIGEHLMPIVSKLTSWLAEHLPAAIEFVKQAVTAVQPTLREIGVVFGDIADVIGKVVSWFRDQFGPSAEGAGGKASQLGQVIGQLKTIFMDAFTIIQTIVQDVIAAVQFIWQNFGDIIIQVAQGLWDSVKQIFQGIMDFVTGIFNLIKDIVTGNWGALWDDVKQIVTGAWEIVKGVITGAWAEIQGIFEAAGRILAAAWSKIWEAIKSGLSSAWEGIKSGVSAGINDVVGFVTGLPGRIFGGLQSLGTDLLKFGGNVMASLLTGISNGWSDIWGFITGLPGKFVHAFDSIGSDLAGLFSSAINGIKGAVKAAWNAVADFFTFTLPTITIPMPPGIDDIKIGGGTVHLFPHLAKGGTALTSGLAVVGEHGAEVVALPAGASVYPHGSMPAGMGGGGNTYITQFNGITDHQELARINAREQAWLAKTKAA